MAAPPTHAKGPYPRHEIEARAPAARCFAAYVLGWLEPDRGRFVVEYVDRCDGGAGGLRAALHRHDGAMPECTHFKYETFDSAAEAYERECALFHAFPSRHRAEHPRVPAGTIAVCLHPGCDAPLRPGPKGA